MVLPRSTAVWNHKRGIISVWYTGREASSLFDGGGRRMYLKNTNISE